MRTSHWLTTTTSWVMGLAHILSQYQDRAVIAELDNMAVSDMVDLVLYDSFAQPDPIMTRSACCSEIRAPTELRSTPGTSTRTLARRA